MWHMKHRCGKILLGNGMTSEPTSHQSAGTPGFISMLVFTPGIPTTWSASSQMCQGSVIWAVWEFVVVRLYLVCLQFSPLQTRG